MKKAFCYIFVFIIAFVGWEALAKETHDIQTAQHHSVDDPSTSKSLSSVSGKSIFRKAKVRRLKALKQKAKNYNIRLKSRKISPDLRRAVKQTLASRLTRKIRTAGVNKGRLLIQFHDLPDEQEREALKEAGISLHHYVPNYAWVASVTDKGAQALSSSHLVRWTGELQLSDKLSQGLREKGVPFWAEQPDGKAKMLVRFHKDVSQDEAQELLDNYSGEVLEKRIVSNSWVVALDQDHLLNIASEDIVHRVANVPPPPIHRNDGAREAAQVDSVQETPYNLSGNGVTIGIWDGGRVDANHDDFGARIIYGDSTSMGVQDHPTHVAGIVGGDGTLSQARGGYSLQWRGMAPSSSIVSYDWNNLFSEIDLGIVNYQIDISQNSWGYALGWDPGSEIDYGNTEYFGAYIDESAEYDAIVHGDYRNTPLSVVFAAGNDRNDVNPSTGQADPLHPDGYECIGLPATGKNMITVGAVNSDDDSMTTFSAWGPTADGRIKPDVVAPGDQVSYDYGIKSTFPGDQYGLMVGTSMAAPVVSGSIALLSEAFEDVYQATPLPSTLKGLLIQTAKDLGRPGPDYIYGYGRVDVNKAVDLLLDQQLVEDQISHNGEQHQIEIDVHSGQDQLKVTLVWDDVPGQAYSSVTLVNDLDLQLRAPDGSTLYYPFVLNKDNPNQTAYTGTDNINNVEQVEVVSPQAGTWTIEISGAFVPQAPQKYSIISNSAFTLDNSPPEAVGDSIAVNEGGTVTLLQSGEASVLNNDSDPDGDTLTAHLDSDVNNGVLVFNSDGSFSYTHNGGETISDSFTYHAEDGVLASPPVLVSINIIPVNDPPVADVDADSTIEDNSVTVNVLANDSDPEGDTLSIVSTGNPVHGTAVISGSSIIYTPNTNYYGSDSFSYAISDGNGGSASSSVYVTIYPVNDPPEADTLSVSTLEDESVADFLSANDPEGDALTYSVVDNGSKGVVSITDSVTGAFTYTPTLNANGADTFTYKVNDGTLDSNIATVTVNVTPVNDSPQAAIVASVNASHLEKQLHLEWEYPLDDPDLAGFRFYYNSVLQCEVDDPAARTLDCLVELSRGEASFWLTAYDSSGVETDPSEVFVTDANLVFSSTTDLIGVTPLTAYLDASDSNDLDGSIVSYYWDLGDGSDANGVTVEYEYVVPGTYTVQLTVTDDQGATAQAAVEIVVTGEYNQAPIASNVSLSTLEDIPITGFLSASDPDGDALIYSVVTNGSKGVAIITNPATGAFTYTPTLNANGVDTFTYKVNDGTLDSNIASFTVNITPVNDLPQADISASVNVDQLEKLLHLEWDYPTDDPDLAGFRFYYNNVLQCEVDNPAARTLDCLVELSRGEASFWLTAYDSSGVETDPSEVFVTDADLIFLSHQQLSGKAPLTVNFDASGSFDPDGSIVDYSWAFGDSVTGNGPTVEHLYSSVGIYSAQVTVTDDQGGIALAEVEIVVSAGQ